MGCEDISCASSSSSAGSIGSFSSGYGSQSTVVAKGEITSFDVKASPTPKSPSIQSNLDTSFSQGGLKQSGTGFLSDNKGANTSFSKNLNATSTQDNKKVIVVKGNAGSSSIYKSSKSTIEGKGSIYTCLLSQFTWK